MGELIIIEKWAENLDQATINAWLVSEGDAVRPGDSLCEIVTDKATFEYEVETAGVVKAIYVPPRSTVPVGYVIAFIGQPCEEPPEGIEEQNSALMAEHRAQAEAEFELDLDLSAVAGRGATASSGRVRATPAARRLAREHNVAIEDVARALDLDGVVGEDDVRRYLDR